MTTERNIFEAENAVVGSILIDPSCIGVVMEILREEDFQLSVNRSIYRAVLALQREDKPIDPVLIREKAQKMGEPVSSTYMLQLMDITPTASHVEAYARQTKEDSLRMAILRLFEESKEKLSAHEDPEKLLADMIQQETEMQQGAISDLVDPIEAASIFLDHRMAVERGDKSGFVATEYRDVDDVLGGGMLSGGVYTLAARPGMGKTTFALNIADRVAKKTGPVLYVSLEMDTEQLYAKRVARLSGIPASKLLMGRTLTEYEGERLAQAMEKLANVPVHLNRVPSADIQKIETMARKVKGISMVVIDYFGIISADQKTKRSSRYEYTTEISGAVKKMARRLKVPVLLLAQLNRASETRQDKRPQLSDLRDTGAVEQDSDGVIFLYREEYYNKKEPKNNYGPEDIEVIVAKNRHGPVGDCKLTVFLPTSKVSTINNDPRQAYKKSQAFRQERMEDLYGDDQKSNTGDPGGGSAPTPGHGEDLPGVGTTPS